MPVISKTIERGHDQGPEVLEKWDAVSDENLRQKSEIPNTTTTMSWKNLKSLDIDISSDVR